jgi:hypothetical protein
MSLPKMPQERLCIYLKSVACGTSASPETLPAMLDDHTITTVCKVKGGLSTTRLRLDFDTSSKVRASYQLLSVDSQPLTFIEKIIADRQSSNTTDNVWQ